jgi:hypothetical protein
MCEMVDFDPVAEILYLSCVILLFEFAGYALNLIFLSVQIQVVLLKYFII